ncbi:MAG: SBBP repeat-containing protein [Ignavibacteria bacterium]|nr:SBBP repeat-containing protein [Ignavibacteria bacterium]
MWSRYYNGGNLDRANSLFIDNQLNILIAGFTFKDTYGDYLILKYAPNGDTLLIKNMNGEDPGSDDEAYSILSDFFGNIYITGASQSTSFRMDYFTLKLDMNGKIIWSKRYRTPHENFAYCLNLDSSGSIYVSGEGELSLGYTGIVSVKYSTITGILSERINEFGSYELYNYPNPFNPTTKINYELRVTNYVSLKVYDVLGNEIAILVKEKQNAGRYSVNFNGANLSRNIFLST